MNIREQDFNPSEPQELSDSEIDAVSGGSGVSSLGYAVGYVLQTASTYYATHDALF